MTFNVRQIWLGRLNERNRAGRKRKENVKKIIVEKTERQRPLTKRRRKCEYNIKCFLNRMGRKGEQLDSSGLGYTVFR